MLAALNHAHPYVNGDPVNLVDPTGHDPQWYKACVRANVCNGSATEGANPTTAAAVEQFRSTWTGGHAADQAAAAASAHGASGGQRCTTPAGIAICLGGLGATLFPANVGPDFIEAQNAASGDVLAGHYSAILRIIDQWLKDNPWARGQMTILPTQLKLTSGAPEFTTFIGGSVDLEKAEIQDLVNQLTSVGANVVTGKGHVEGVAKGYRAARASGEAQGGPIEDVINAIETVRACSAECGQDFTDFLDKPGVRVFKGDTGILSIGGQTQVLNEYRLDKIEEFTRAAGEFEAISEYEAEYGAGADEERR